MNKSSSNIFLHACISISSININYLLDVISRSSSAQTKAYIIKGILCRISHITSYASILFTFTFLRENINLKYVNTHHNRAAIFYSFNSTSSRSYRRKIQKLLKLLIEDKLAEKLSVYQQGMKS